MKIKTLLSLLFICVLVLLVTSSLQCHKHKDEPQKEKELPPITQEGKNAFGCRINGEVWVPYYSCSGMSSNPCGELVVDVHQISPNDPSLFSLNIAAEQKKEDNSLTVFSIHTLMNQGISSTGNKIDSLTINFQRPVAQLYYNYNYYNKIEKFEISKLDTVNKIISGLFELTLYKSPSDSVMITDGRFDLKFQVCKCSN